METGTLIVDDQEDMRMLVRMIIELANEGLTVKGEAATGPEALERLDEDDPVVIVLDQMMPEMTGLETAALIRSRRPTPIIVLCSAYLSDDVVREARAVGIEWCVRKDEMRSLPDVIRAAAGI